MRLLKMMLIAGLSLSCLSAEAGKKNKAKKEEKTEAQAKHKKPALEDTYWRLSPLNNITLPTSGNEPYIYLHKGKIMGSTGCNDIMGKYNSTSRGNRLKLNATTTQMACSGPMEAEALMMRTISQATNYKENGDNLMLYNGIMLLAIFEVKQP